MTKETKGLINSLASADSYSISNDGKFVAFISLSSNLVANDTNNISDVFVYDRDTGETTRVSVNSDGIEGGFALGSRPSAPALSADGRFVAFDSYATNLVTGDTANFSIDVFVHDRLTGQTTIVSVDSNGLKGNNSSFAPSISADGRFVFFSSTADNLVSDDTNNSVDRFIHDRLTGKTTRFISERSFVDSASADGKFIAFISYPNYQVFVQNRETGETTIVSVNSDGVTPSRGSSPSISADGRFVAFSSDSDALVANDTNNASDIFVRDLLIGKTTRVSLYNGEQVDFGTVSPSISADGKFIAFAGNDNQNSIFLVDNPFAINTVNRLSSEVNADGAMRKYTYDHVGNITSITDRDGTVQAFTYDKLNRRTQEQWFDVLGNVTRNITSTYNAAGELTQISDPDSTYRYTYDLDGRMLTNSNQGTPNIPTTIMSYSYDNVGNMLSMTDTIAGNLGVTTTRQYDALNRLTVNAQGNKRVDYAYNAISQVTNKKRYADTTGTNLVAETSHIYDSISRLTNITHSKGANIISSYAQTYDAGSKITSVTGTDGSSTYTYDNTNQLTGADYDFQTDESYTYDSNGNRTNDGNVTGVNNRLLEDNQYRYEYDIVGNRTRRTDKSTDEVTEYSWDIRDRLTGIVVKDVNGDIIKSAQYKYDVYNQRIAKTVDADGDGAAVATTERYVYGRDQNIGLVFDENGNLNHRYLFGDGVDQIEADESNGTVRWALSDHLGSVRDVVDNSGTVLNHVVYDAFGGVTSQSNASVVFRYGYTARELDAESGLQYNRARYLDSFTGKFISEDPISFQGGDSNLYRYVANNSLNLVDPTGTYGVVTYQIRLINYEVFSQSGVSRKNTTDIQNVLDERSFGNSVIIRSDLTVATIVYSPTKTGGTFSQLQIPPDFIEGNDQRGHIVGNQLGGSNSNNNLFAQNRSKNMGRLGGYEDKVKKHLDPPLGTCPRIPILLNYDFTLFYAGYSLRPVALSSTATFNDGQFFSTNGIISNP